MNTGQFMIKIMVKRKTGTIKVKVFYLKHQQFHLLSQLQKLQMMMQRKQEASFIKANGF